MNHTPNYVHADYLEPIVRTGNLRKAIDDMCEALSPYEYEFDAVAFTGISGALLGPAIAMRMDKTMLVVRKQIAVSIFEPEAFCHSTQFVEGDYGARRYIVVDETICTGKTFRTIQERIRAAVPTAECIGFMGLWDVQRNRVRLRLPEPAPPVSKDIAELAAVWKDIAELAAVLED